MATTTLKERLEKALGERQELSKSGLAQACRVKQPSVSDWFNGRTKRLTGANLLNAARYLGVSPEWLASGKPPMRATEVGVDPPVVPSHSVGREAEMMRESIRWLQGQFETWRKPFDVAERMEMVLAVYNELATPSESNLIDLSQRLAIQVMEEGNDRQDQTASSSSNDRKGNTRGSRVAKVANH